MKFNPKHTKSRLNLLTCLVASAMLSLTACQTEKEVAPVSKTTTKTANANGTIASSSYSSIYGPTTSCPGRIDTYTYTVNGYNMMRPISATLTVTGGVFIPSGTTSLTWNSQVGSKTVQVQWSGAGTLSGSYKWTNGMYGGPIYTDNISGSVSMNCAQ